MSNEELRAVVQVEREAAEREAWGPLVPFGELNLPAFPTDVLPQPLRRWVEAEATALQVPRDLPAMLALSVCAAAVARKTVVRVRDGWMEPTNLYTVTVLPPGERKSPVFLAATRPLEEFEEAEARRAAPEIAEAEAKHRIAEATLAKAEVDAAKAAPDERTAEVAAAAALARDLAGMTIPATPRFVADDVTAETLATMLAEQGGRMAVMSPEGDVFDIIAGRYSRDGAPNLGVFLKGHAGDTLRVNRRGRAEYVRGPALTVALAVQPDVLHGLMARPRFRGRGLLGRFLYALPASLLGIRNTKAEPVPPSVSDAYADTVGALLALPFGTDDAGKPAPHVVALSPAAALEVERFEAWLEPQLAERGSLGAMRDWAGKLVGAVVRVAGVLHAVLHVDKQPWAVPLAGSTLRDAVRLAKEYLIRQARAAYGMMGADPAMEGARRVLRWLADAGSETFTRREAHRALQSRFERAGDLDEPLRVLEERGYIRPLPPPQRDGPGRRPSPTYQVRPQPWSPADTIDALTEPPAHVASSVNNVDSVTPYFAGGEAVGTTLPTAVGWEDI